MSSIESFKINTPKITYETIDGEVVIIDFETGNYYSIDKVGAEIWRLLEKKATFGKMLSEISNRYNCSSDKFENTLSEFLSELQDEQLICEEPTSEDNVKASTKSESMSDGKKLSFEKPKLQKYDDMQDLLLLDPIHEVDKTGWPSVKPDAFEKGKKNSDNPK